MLDARYYRFFTLLAQSLASIVVGLEALWKYNPSIFVDTVGFSFIYPFAKYLYAARVICYVHYPTISSDMLEKVQHRITDFNNASIIAKSSYFSQIKLIYYHLFSFLYYLAGSCADLVFVNSSWTLNHIQTIWKSPSAKILFPPCDTKDLMTIPLQPRERIILSVAQFRPEKAHVMQIDAFHKLLKDHPEYRFTGKSPVKLVLLGGVRNQMDQKLVDGLRNKIRDLELNDSITIVMNASHSQLKEYYRKSTMGLHTMRDEHFGIGVVEYMAAGLIPLAHGTAGPMMDIVVPFNEKPTGFLATSIEEYAEKMQIILELSNQEKLELQKRARESVLVRFSNETFSELISKYIQAFL